MTLGQAAPLWWTSWQETSKTACSKHKRLRKELVALHSHCVSCFAFQHLHRLKNIFRNKSFVVNVAFSFA